MRQTYKQVPNPDGYLRIGYWFCGENPNNTVVETDEGTSQFSDFTFTRERRRRTKGPALQESILRRAEVRRLRPVAAAHEPIAQAGPVPCGHGLSFSIRISL